MCEHSLCEHSVFTSHHITHHKPKEENTKKKFLGRVLGPDRRNLTTSHITHITSRHITHDTVILSPHHTSRITSRKKRTQRRSSWPECLGRMSRIDAISPHHTSHIIASHQPSDITSHHITHHKPKEEHTKKKFLGRVLGPDGSPHHITDITSHHITHYKPKEENTKKKFLGRVLEPDRRNLTTSHITHHCISPDIRHHISPHHTSQAERREPQEEVLGPSSWAGWLTTPHHISDIHISSHAHLITPHHTSHIHISPHQTPQRRSSASFWMAHHTTSHIRHSHLITCTSHHTTSHITHSYLTTSNTTKEKFCEFFHANPLQEHPRRTKSTRIAT